MLINRYEINLKVAAHHQSMTCVVYLGIDHEDNDRKVCLKFMSHTEEFERELTSRLLGGFQEPYVISIITSYRGDWEGDPLVRQEFHRKGLGKYPYLLVMDAGDRSLQVHTDLLFFTSM